MRTKTFVIASLFSAISYLLCGPRLRAVFAGDGQIENPR
jgi:hypothetical protein